MTAVRPAGRSGFRTGFRPALVNKWAGGGTAGAAPVNTVLPVISGEPGVGQTLSVTNGTWTNSPTGFTFQWERGGVDIVGATASTYTLVSADSGNTITCTVTASNAFGSGSATSLGIGVFTADMWLDFSDASTLFTDTGGTTPVTADNDLIALIEDKTASAYDYQQPTSGNRPLYKTNIVGSLSVGRFDGTDDNMDAVRLDMANNRSQLSIFTVVKFSLVPVVQQLSYGITRTDTAASSRLAVGTDVDNANYVAGGRRENSGSFDNAVGGPLVDEFVVEEAFYDFAAAELTLYIDGVFSGSSIPFSTAGNTTAANELAARIGSAGTDGAFMDGDIGEMIVVQDAITTAERDAIYSYLGAKWA